MHINSNIAPTTGLRTQIGTDANGCERTDAHAQVTAENLAAAQGRVRDPAVAAAMVAFACEQIRRRAGGGVLARAAGAPQTILRLLE